MAPSLIINEEGAATLSLRLETQLSQEEAVLHSLTFDMQLNENEQLFNSFREWTFSLEGEVVS